LETWLNSLSVRLNKTNQPLGFSKSVAKDNLEIASYAREFPKREVVASGMKALVTRNISMYSIITGGQSEIINHSTQFKESFSDVNFANLLTVEYYPKMDHIITNPEYQRIVIDNICIWIDQVIRNT
jgi:hypothetical protein